MSPAGGDLRFHARLDIRIQCNRISVQLVIYRRRRVGIHDFEVRAGVVLLTGALQEMKDLLVLPGCPGTSSYAPVISAAVPLAFFMDSPFGLITFNEAWPFASRKVPADVAAWGSGG